MLSLNISVAAVLVSIFNNNYVVSIIYLFIKRGFKVLILTRNIRETVNIGDEVTVTVLGVNGNQVRIGVNAPKNIEVHREEIYMRIQREKNQNKAS